MNSITLESINNRITDLEQKLDEIKSLLNEIKFSQNNIERGTHLMESHIGLIETVYDKVRAPLGYATNMINNIIGNNTPNTILPILDNTTLGFQMNPM
jgi:hypothetical protein